jgi:hypothetical protein
MIHQHQEPLHHIPSYLAKKGKFSNNSLISTCKAAHTHKHHPQKVKPGRTMHDHTCCHAQLLAATNRVTEQLNWLTVESFFMSCSISWMASLIDKLYLLDLIALVIN